MPNLANYGRPSRPPRLLNLAQITQRLRQQRPLRLDAVSCLLHSYERLLRIVSLIQTHFPDKQVVFNSDAVDDWVEALGTFLGLVDEEWFPIDWEYVEAQWGAAMNTGEAGYMEEMLYGIPFEQSGLVSSEFDEGHQAMYESPVLYLCFLLTQPHEGYVFEVDYFKSEIDYDHNRCLVEQTDWSRLDEPFCWLNEAFAVAQGVYADNPFLAPHDYEMWDEYPAQNYLWSRHVEPLQQAWQEARLIVDHLNRLNGWLGNHRVDLRKIEQLLIPFSRKEQAIDPPYPQSAYLVDILAA